MLTPHFGLESSSRAALRGVAERTEAPLPGPERAGSAGRVPGELGFRSSPVREAQEEGEELKQRSRGCLGSAVLRKASRAGRAALRGGRR